MQTRDKRKKKKSNHEEKSEINVSLYTSTPPTPSTIPICDGDMCALPSASPVSTSSFSMCEGDTCSPSMSEPMSFLEEDHIKETNSTKTFVDTEEKASISKELLQSAVTGFTSAASLTLLTEILEAGLKKQKYTQEQRY